MNAVFPTSIPRRAARLSSLLLFAGLMTASAGAQMVMLVPGESGMTLVVPDWKPAKPHAPVHLKKKIDTIHLFGGEIKATSIKAAGYPNEVGIALNEISIGGPIVADIGPADRKVSIRSGGVKIRGGMPKLHMEFLSATKISYFDPKGAAVSLAFGSGLVDLDMTTHRFHVAVTDGVKLALASKKDNLNLTFDARSIDASLNGESLAVLAKGNVTLKGHHPKADVDLYASQILVSGGEKGRVSIKIGQPLKKGKVRRH